MLVIAPIFLVFLGFSDAFADRDTLVLLDNLAIKETHSIFFKNLQGKPKF